MKIKKTRIFFMSIGFVLESYCPFHFFSFLYIVSLWIFVNKISQEALESGS